jgi:hypothetical protein
MSLKWDENTADGAALRERLRHVYWIGGGSGAGKSTVAGRIAARHGLRIYATDGVMADHARRSTHEDSPLLHGFMAMNMDERWVNRPRKPCSRRSTGSRARASTSSSKTYSASRASPGHRRRVPAVVTPRRAPPLRTCSGRLAPPDARLPPGGGRESGRIGLGVSRQDHRS